jgi:hypothetical protein
MKTFYIVYLNLREDGNVIFSSPFSSFNNAKENIETFLNDYAGKIGKKCIFISKEDLEKYKNSKTLEDCLYVRKKNSEATIYCRNVLTGYFRNTHLLCRYGNIGINEINIPDCVPNNKVSFVEQKKEEVKKETVEKMSHGVHVTFISELKNALINRRNNIDNVVKVEEKGKAVNPFVTSLIERKESLKNITPPPERKLIL